MLRSTLEAIESRVIGGGFIIEKGGPSMSESGFTAGDCGHLELDFEMSSLRSTVGIITRLHCC